LVDPAGHVAPIDVVVDAVIRRSPEVVAAYASDPSNAPQWYANISEVVWKTTTPLQVGVISWRVRWCVFGTLGALLTHESAPFERAADDLVPELVRTLSAALAA